MATVIEREVKDTAAWLDANSPGWAERVNLDSLRKSAPFERNDKNFPAYRSAWLAEIAARTGTPESEEAAIEASAVDAGEVWGSL